MLRDEPTWAVVSSASVAAFYTVVHCDAGPLETFETRKAAERELARVVRDEPTWARRCQPSD